MPKSTKTFILSTSQLNSHGFRTMTSGANLDDFRANPVMYWLHMEPTGKSTDEPLPIGYWEDIKVEGDEITAVPNFDDNDEFAMKIYNKVEHGTIRAASIEVEPIKLDANKKNWVKGQKLPTVTEWRTGEASIVDRGSNRGAIAKLKHAGLVIALSDKAATDQLFSTLQTTEPDMSKIKLNKKASTALKLSEDTEMDATEVVDKLVEVIEGNEAALQLKDAKIAEIQGAAKTEKIKLMLDKAVADRKITEGQRPTYLKLSEKDLESTEELLNSMKGSESLSTAITGEQNEGEVAKLMKLSWEELHGGAGLTKLKELSPDSYKLKFKEKFGKEPV